MTEIDDLLSDWQKLQDREKYKADWLRRVKSSIMLGTTKEEIDQRFELVYESDCNNNRAQFTDALDREIRKNDELIISDCPRVSVMFDETIDDIKVSFNRFCQGGGAKYPLIFIQNDNQIDFFEEVAGRKSIVGRLNFERVRDQRSELIYRWSTPEFRAFCEALARQIKRDGGESTNQAILGDQKRAYTESDKADQSIGPATSEPKSEQAAKDYRTEKEKQIDSLCIKWAGRNFHTGNMSDFLNENGSEIGGKYMTIDYFKRALRSAGERGLIIKNSKGRWKLPSSKT